VTAIVTANELGAMVGLPNQVAERDAAPVQVLLNAGGEDGAGGSRTALGKGPEQQAAAHVAGGVLDGGEIESLGLEPVVGDVVQVFGVGGDLLKDAPSGFDVGEGPVCADIYGDVLATGHADARCAPGHDG
jgi:hypothetical protein